jgi:outer membrane protein assembly factor BamA
MRDTVITLIAATTFSAATGCELGAQTAGRTPGPEIERLELRGVRLVPIEQVKRAMETRPTACRLWLLTPLCRVMRASLLVRKHYLDSAQLARDVVSLRDFYWRRGFREVQVDTSVQPSRHGVAVTFDVQEGPPTLIDSVVVEQATPVLDTATIQRALRLRSGSPIDLSALDTTLIALHNALWDAGYADAILSPNVQVNQQTHRATVRIGVNPRWQTRVASITIEGNERLSDAALRSALTLRPGDIYRRRNVLESQRHLYESPVVRLAFMAVPPLPDTASDSRTQVVVRVQERRPFQFGVDAALNTSDFLQVAGRVGLFALAGGRWQLVLRGATGNLFASRLEGDGPFTDVVPDDSVGSLDDAFARPTWQTRAEATRLWAGSPRNQMMFAAYGQRLSEPGVFIDRAVGLFTSFTRELADRAPVSVSYRIERAAVDAGEVYFCEGFGLCDAEAVRVFRDPRRLSSVTLNAWLDRSNGLVAPSRGQTARLGLDYASSVLGSEYEYFRVDGEATAYLPVRSWVLAGRAHAGWAHAESGVLHPRTLFYAGGAQSVRGFGENQLGPRVLRAGRDDLLASGCTDASIADGSCDPNAAPARAFFPRPVGATTLLEGSIELRIRFTGRLGGVLFADGGVVGPGAGALSAERVGAVTPGMGLRYELPVGALRLDAGWRPDRTEHLPVVVETRAADGSTQVTPLATDRRWSSSDDANGKSGALRRITLHFAVGHAF